MVENGTNWRRSYETATMPATGSKKLEPIGNETRKLPRLCKSEAGPFSDSGSQTSNAIPKLQWKRSWKHSALEPDRFAQKLLLKRVHVLPKFRFSTLITGILNAPFVVRPWRAVCRVHLRYRPYFRAILVARPAHRVAEHTARPRRFTLGFR